ncbi:T6SS phospholipase effector Tle1-like catalytic domain-containing protein [Aspergillus homomorphus CBS 101889]|uniref:T6SS Phospholipase effector Tle1-like catalytic domain-containing protein n=1 Tax=Aspergillus homomorphus (strain CBS 101889) TaxID=1450537 RepID=A0A395HJT3_ASPHC|nr:hypothetical protein BO97DRAFT_355093 [Aspergillus homomorphus CBS 101889]RAL08030.1 hypothetical protein BO97DRAFT_355093 [Aspergillus homomorphus CBS 101889]
MTGSTSSPPVPKRIILCFDGTWQTAVSGKQNCPSNITRLCRAIKPVDRSGEKEWQQVVWYDSGVGTTSLAVSKMLEGAVGDGLDGNVVEAYNFVAMNWNPGDKILCFGFSRGAYTARAIAGLISDVGICERRDLHRFPELWKLYKKPRENRPFYCSDDYFRFIDGRASENHRKHGTDTGLAWEANYNHDWAQKDSRLVEVVAVYDTVQALGIPEVAGVQLPAYMMFWKDPPGWHNVNLSRHIKHAIQALALDEYRNAFYPEVWCLPKEGYPNVTEENVRLSLEKTAKEKLKALNEAGKERRRLVKEAQEHGKLHPTDYTDDNLHLGIPKLTQVWFPGYHINIGGGSSDTLLNHGDMEEMSNIVFAWMLDQIKPHVAINKWTIKDDYNRRQERFRALNAARRKDAPKEGEKESWRAYIGRGAKRVASTVMHPLTPAPYSGERVYTWGLADMPDSFTSMYIPNGKRGREPSANVYKDPKTKKEIIGFTCAQIHPIVNFRVENKKNKTYLPMGLSAGQYSRRLVGKEFVYSLDGEDVPEWHLGGENSYEWMALKQHEDALQYIFQQEQDRMTGSTNTAFKVSNGVSNALNSVPEGLHRHYRKIVDSKFISTEEKEEGSVLESEHSTPTGLLPLEELSASSFSQSPGYQG